MKKVLEINHLTKKYKHLTAVNDLSFSVEEGNVYGLLGPNGSGKSTTLGIILNVINPTSGSWKWFGEPPSIQSFKKIGAILEHPNFYPYLSAQKNLEIVAQIKRVSYDNIQSSLELVNLYERKDDKYSSFSLGMKQRLAIASAMLSNPKVLILDEPTNGLDPQGIIKIREIIKQIAANGTTIILASHLLDEVEKLCSHVVILEKGKTLYSGAVDTLTNSFGYFELATTDLKTLETVLQTFPFVEKISNEEKFLKVLMKEDVSPDLLNKMLFEKGFILNHLVKRKESLEVQFLKITHQNYGNEKTLKN